MVSFHGLLSTTFFISKQQTKNRKRSLELSLLSLLKPESGHELHRKLPPLAIIEHTKMPEDLFLFTLKIDPPFRYFVGLNYRSQKLCLGHASLMALEFVGFVSLGW
ncbi:hypothetical protein GQ457_07G008550 [Hibiscus cannabinus]